MSNSTTAPVLVATAAVVREAFAAGKFTAPEKALPSLNSGRGRISPVAVEAFLASKAGKGYTMPFLGNTDSEGNPVVKVSKPAATIEVPRVSVDAKGRRRTLKPVTMTVAEVRALAGVEGKRGRLSKAAIEAAGAAHVAQAKAAKAPKA